MQFIEIIQRDFFLHSGHIFGAFFKTEHAQPRLLICSKIPFITLLIGLLASFIGLDKQTF